MFIWVLFGFWKEFKKVISKNDATKHPPLPKTLIGPTQGRAAKREGINGKICVHIARIYRAEFGPFGHQNRGHFGGSMFLECGLGSGARGGWKSADDGGRAGTSGAAAILADYGLQLREGRGGFVAAAHRDWRAIGAAQSGDYRSGDRLEHLYYGAGGHADLRGGRAHARGLRAERYAPGF